MLISSVPWSSGCRVGFLFHPFGLSSRAQPRDLKTGRWNGKGRGTEQVPLRRSNTRPPNHQPHLSPTTAPLFVIPSAVEGSAVRLSPSTNFYMSSSIGHAEEPFFQQECRKVTPGNEAAAIETHVPLPIRCWSSKNIPGRSKAHSRSLDCARDNKKGGQWKGIVGSVVCSGFHRATGLNPGNCNPLSYCEICRMPVCSSKRIADPGRELK